MVYSRREIIIEVIAINHLIVHHVGIKIDVDVLLCLNFASISIRVVSWGFLEEWDLFTSKGQLISVVDHTVFVVGKTAESFGDFLSCHANWISGKLSNKLSIFVGSLDGSIDHSADTITSIGFIVEVNF